MDKKFIDYIRKLDILDEGLDIDFSDLAFAYDYNEVQELYFDIEKNNYVFLAGETGLRKKDMLARICKDLTMRGVEKEDILYLDYELPILHTADILDIVEDFYEARSCSENVHLIVNEIQFCGDWFGIVGSLREKYPKLRFLCSSSTPPYIFETIYDNGCEYCKIVVLSKKNASNIKYETQTFGVYEEFKYNQKGGFIEIKGMTKEGKKMPHHVVPSTINGLPVRVIASGAFHDRSEMLTIELPDCVEMIGDYAFSKCCNLKEIKLPKALTYIGDHSFLGATSLERIIGGELVNHIGNSAFYKTKWLDMQKDFAVIGKTLYKYVGTSEYVLIPEHVTHIASYSFADTCVKKVKATQNITVNEGSFYQCKNLNYVHISMDEIPPFCFCGCDELKQEFTVSSVGKFGLYGCTSIERIASEKLNNCALAFCVELKEIHSLSIVEDGALFNCKGLTQLNRDVVLEKIGRFAFSGTGLVSLSFQGNSIGDYAFYNVTALTYAKIIHTAAVGKAIFYKCRHLRTLTIGGNKKLTYHFGGEMPHITKLYVHGDIVDDFCRGNQYLENLQIMHADHFGRWSFYGNSALREISFTQIKAVGDWAFAYCDGIEKIELPKTVEHIGMNAFRYCHNLSEIKILAEKCVSFGANAFYSTSEHKTFFVKSSVRSEYENVPIWHEYLDSITILH